MNKVVNDETSNLIILNQYIKDLSYENFQKNGTQNFDIKENSTNIEINVIHEPYGEINFGVSIKITINCKSKNKCNKIFEEIKSDMEKSLGGKNFIKNTYRHSDDKSGKSLATYYYLDVDGGHIKIEYMD